MMSSLQRKGILKIYQRDRKSKLTSWSVERMLCIISKLRFYTLVAPALDIWTGSDPVLPMFTFIRLLELVAEDNALEDAIYHLSRYFNSDTRTQDELERFLKVSSCLLAELCWRS